MEDELENDLEDLADKQQTIREKRIAQLRPYQWKKGQSGNSLGRYVGGISGKERMKRKIAGMSDDEFEDFIEGINKIDLFKMAEGNPESNDKLKVMPEVGDAPLIKELNDSIKELIRTRNKS